MVLGWNSNTIKQTLRDYIIGILNTKLQQREMFIIKR